MKKMLTLVDFACSRKVLIFDNLGGLSAHIKSPIDSRHTTGPLTSSVIGNFSKGHVLRCLDIFRREITC